MANSINYTLYIQWRKIFLLLDSFWINISPILGIFSFLIVGLFSPKHNYFIRFEAHSACNITFVYVFGAAKSREQTQKVFNVGLAEWLSVWTMGHITLQYGFVSHQGRKKSIGMYTVWLSPSDRGGFTGIPRECRDVYWLSSTSGSPCHCCSQG